VQIQLNALFEVDLRMLARLLTAPLISSLFTFVLHCVAHMALDFAESSSATHESDDPADSPQPCRKIIAFWIDFVTFGYKVSSQGVVTHMVLDFA
jgi:hypothetical protein